MAKTLLRGMRVKSKEEPPSPLPALMRGVEPALIDSITREMVTGKQGNMIAGPGAAGSSRKIQGVSRKRKARRREQKVGTRCFSF
jgi:hypothetical protein